MTVWICSGIVVVFVVIFVISFNYRVDERKQINREMHRLWFLYGIAMFLVDKLLRKILIRNTRTLDEKFKHLHVKEKVDVEKYLYVVSKLAMSIGIVFLSAFIGLALQISKCGADYTVSELTRNQYGEGDKYYVLEASDGTNREEIEISVPQEEITDEEALKILEEYKDDLIKKVLGENTSQDKVTKPLNLPGAIGKENIQIIWEIENEDVIGYDGSIGEAADKEGTITRLYATMYLKKVSIVQEIVLNVYPPEDDGNIQEMVQKIINAYDAWEEKIPLPKSLAKKSITYSEKKDESAIVLLMIGIIAAIAIFFLKDKDMDKELEERNIQLVLDYPEVVNKIMLLNRAGMSMRKAWEQTIESAGVKRKHYVYREMRMALIKINGGISEATAYEQFGKRCGVHCYIRFSNIICQNLRRGSGEMCRALEYELQNALLEKKNKALKLGEQAGTKLLGPMVIMLIVGLALIVVPAFMSVKY